MTENEIRTEIKLALHRPTQAKILIDMGEKKEIVNEILAEFPKEHKRYMGRYAKSAEEIEKSRKGNRKNKKKGVYSFDTKIAMLHYKEGLSCDKSGRLLGKSQTAIYNWRKAMNLLGEMKKCD